MAMLSEVRDATGRALQVIGGQLCLDFANTVEPRGGVGFPVPNGYAIREYLSGYAAFVAWARHIGAVDEATVAHLAEQAEAHPDIAHGVYARTIALREAIYRVFWAVAHRQAPADDDLALIAREHADGAAHATLIAEGQGFAWGWPAGVPDLARPLWPIAWSATTLLTTGDPQRVKACPGTPGHAVPCAWLFYDTTKNRIRQWCTMADCGGKTKALRQTSRRRAARKVAPT